MGQWQKSHPDLIARFLAAVPQQAGVEQRKMFGYPCLFVNGNMAVGLHEQRLVVRHPELAQSQPFVVLGRRMSSYGVIENALQTSEPEFKRWLQKALAHTQTLPPKAAKVAKAAKKAPARKAAAAKTSAKTSPAAKKASPAKAK